MRYYEPPQFDVKSLFVPDMTPWEQMIKMKEYEFAQGKELAEKQQNKIDKASAEIEDYFNKIKPTGGARTSDYARDVINPAIEVERQKAHAQLEANPNAANGILFNAISNIKNITNSRAYQNILKDQSFLPEAYKSSIVARNQPMVHQNYLDENGSFKQLSSQEIENTNWTPNLYESYQGKPIQQAFNWIVPALKDEIRKEYGDVDLQTVTNAQGIPTTYIVKSGGQKITELTRPMIEKKLKPYVEKYKIGDDYYTGYKSRTMPGYNNANLLTDLSDYLSLYEHRNVEEIPDEYTKVPGSLKAGSTGGQGADNQTGLPNIIGNAIDVLSQPKLNSTYTLDKDAIGPMVGAAYDPNTNTSTVNLSNQPLIYNYNTSNTKLNEQAQDINFKLKIADNYKQIIANDDRFKALLSASLGTGVTVETSDDGKSLVKKTLIKGGNGPSKVIETLLSDKEVFSFITDLLNKPGAKSAYPELNKFKQQALFNGVDLSDTKDLDEHENWKKQHPLTSVISKAFEEGTFNGNYTISYPQSDNTVIDKKGDVYVKASIEIPAEEIEQVLFPDDYGPGTNYEDLIDEKAIKIKYDGKGNKSYVADVLIPSKTDINSATTDAQIGKFGTDKITKEEIAQHINTNNNKAIDLKGKKLKENVIKLYNKFLPEDKQQAINTAKNNANLYPNFNYIGFVNAVEKSNDPEDFADLILSIQNPQAFLNMLNNRVATTSTQQSSSGGGANMGKPQVGVKVR